MLVSSPQSLEHFNPRTPKVWPFVPPLLYLNDIWWEHSDSTGFYGLSYTEFLGFNYSALVWQIGLIFPGKHMHVISSYLAEFNYSVLFQLMEISASEQNK